MTTSWTTPKTIIQYAQDQAEGKHVPWDVSTNFVELMSVNEQFVKTTKPLIHISRSPKPDVVEKTYYLHLSGFNFVELPEVIVGIECRLTCNRGGRITDDTIELVSGDTVIGDNIANRNLDLIKVYGGDLSTWGITTLDPEVVRSNQFGIRLRFKSHPSWPHKTTAKIASAELRIY